MSIEKNTKNTLQHEEAPFTTLINEVLNNIRHTGALGVYCYLASKSSGWNICKKQLQNHFGCGRKHIDSCFKYLKEIGVIHILMIRDSKGRAIGWETILKRTLPAQHIQNTQKVHSGELSRIPISHNVENPDCGKGTPINKRYIEIKDIINNISTSDEVADFYYTQIENLKAEECPQKKSDYLNNHKMDHPDDSQVFESEIDSTKSDYFENQPINQSNSKSLKQYGLKEILNDNIFQLPQELIQDWIANRKKKRAAITQTAWNKINKELTKCQEHGINPIESFETMVASGWQSLKVEYFITKESITKAEQAKKRSIELEEIVTRRKQKEIDDSKRFTGIVSQASEHARSRLRELIGSRPPESVSQR